MAQNHTIPPQNVNPSDKEQSKNEPITYDEFGSILFGQEMKEFIYTVAMQHVYDIEIRFEKDGTPKVYLKKVKRVTR